MHGAVVLQASRNCGYDGSADDAASPSGDPLGSVRSWPIGLAAEPVTIRSQPRARLWYRRGS